MVCFGKCHFPFHFGMPFRHARDLEKGARSRGGALSSHFS